MFARFLLSALALLAGFAHGAPSESPDLREFAERFVRQQTSGLGKSVHVEVAPLSPTTRLPTCAQLEAYAPAGSRFWGKSYVGIRCLRPQSWSLLLPVTIRVQGQYVVAAQALIAGQLVSANDLATREGELTSMPAGIVEEPAQAIGKTVRNALAAGQALRREHLLAPTVIRQGQTVQLISRGAGFSVSAEGKAINNAAEGEVVQLRMSNGQTASGIARQNGTAEISLSR